MKVLIAKERFFTSRRKYLSMALLAAFFILLAACAREPEEDLPVVPGDTEGLKNTLGHYVEKLMDRYDVPGVSIALVSDGRIVWTEGFGYADREKKIPATAETVYQVASISKPITAAAAAILLERGKLDIDHPVTSYLPGFSMQYPFGEPAPVTVRALLSHHGGLPRYHLKGIVSGEPRSLLDGDLHREYTLFQPGERFEYSNVGFALLGDVIEEVSGVSFASFVEEELFRPLGMLSSGFSLDEGNAPRLAVNYKKDGPMPFMPFRDHASSAMMSSVLDLGNFLRFILAGGELDGKRILAEETVDMLFEPQYPGAPASFGISYGLGWFLGGEPDFQRHELAWHNGRTLASWSRIVLLRNKKVGVVVLSNAQSGRPLVHRVSHTAAKLLLAYRGESSVEAPEREAERAPTEPPPPSDQEEFPGFYSFGGYLVEVFREGKHIKVRADDEVLHLIPDAGRRFRVKKRFLGLFYINTPLPLFRLADAGGRTYIVTDAKGIRVGEKIPSYRIPDSWLGRLGEYRLINPDETAVVHFNKVRLAKEKGILVLGVDSDAPEARGKLVLEPVTDDVAYLIGGTPLGGPNGALAAYREDAIDRFRYSGYIFEKISP